MQNLNFETNQKSSSISFCTQYNLPAFGTQPEVNLRCGLKNDRQPTYLDSYGNAKVIAWKQYQRFHELDAEERSRLNRKWQAHLNCGVSTIMGFNGSIYTHGIDLDAACFIESDLPHKELKAELRRPDSPLRHEAIANLNHAVEALFQNYPALREAHRFTTPSGGLRIIVGSAQQLSNNFGANSGFALSKYQDKRCGELLTGNGGHTLMPGAAGYTWQQFPESIVMIDNLEEIFFPVGHIPKEIKQARLYLNNIDAKYAEQYDLSLIHISEPTRLLVQSRMTTSA